MRKQVAVFLSGVLIGLQASAEIPYAQLEALRRQSVAVRVALDNPENSEVKACGIKSKNFAALGAKLEQAMDQKAEKWQSLTLKEEDLTSLKSKISVCAERGSCQVYEKFLSAVKVEDKIKSQIAEQQELLSKKLEKLESESYLKALKTIPDLCKILAP